MLRAVVIVLLLTGVVALHPRPQFDDVASFARWLVHESDYAIVATHHDGGVFSNVMSVADGEGPEHSTGVIYTYLPSLDATYKDLMKNSNVSLTWSEMTLANGTSGGCLNATAENAPCGRVTITGRLVKVPEANKSTALRYLFATHPIMKLWSAVHLFEPFWLEPTSMDQFFVVNMFGGAKPVNAVQYFAADWYRKTVPKDSFICGVCGHVYDPKADGKGRAFEDLPTNWTCPVCGTPKSAYHKTMKGGKTVWVHDDHPEAIV